MKYHLLSVKSQKYILSVNSSEQTMSERRKDNGYDYGLCPPHLRYATTFTCSGVLSTQPMSHPKHFQSSKFLKKNCSKNCVKTLRDEFLRSPDKNLWFVSFSKTSLKSPIALKTPIRIMSLFPFHCFATSPPRS